MDELAHINRLIADHEMIIEGLKLRARQYDPESQHKTELPFSDKRRDYRITDPKTILDPLAHSMIDLATPKQVARLRAAAREKGLDAEQECQTAYRCRIEELSKRAASALIDQIEGLTTLAGR